MTRGELRADMVLRASAWVTTPYSTDTARNELINKRLFTWTARTRCLYDQAITLTHGNSAGPFSLADSTKWTLSAGGAAKLIEVCEVYVDGNLTDRDDKANLSTRYGSISSADGVWTVPNDGTIKFSFTPTADNTIVVGAYHHQPAIATTSGDDSVALRMPDEMLEDFSKWCFLGYIEHTATSGDLLEKYREIRSECEAAIAGWRRRMDQYPMIGQRRQTTMKTCATRWWK